MAEPEDEAEEDFNDRNDFKGDELIVMEDEREQANCVVQRILLAPKQLHSSQWHSIFRSRFTINKKVCDVIIDCWD